MLNISRSLASVFSPVLQAVGILGVALTIFQGLEPFLKFSMLVAYFVEHWRILTRGLWNWVLFFIPIELPSLLLDIFTLFLFLAMFSVRVLSRRRIEEEKMVLPRQIKSLLCRIEEKGSLVYGLTLIGFWWNIFAFALPLAIFFILFPHLDIFWVLITAIVLSSIYGAAIFVVALKKLGSRVNSSVMPFQIVL